MASEYDDSNIQVLEGLEAVRVRPGMYIGSTGSKGLHHLVYEVVDNSIEEAQAGYCKNIDISINANGSITVIDDGRGIEDEGTPQTGEFSIEKIFTTLHIGKYYEGGLRDYVAYLDRDRQPLNEEVIHTRAEKDRIRVEVALQWCDAERGCVLGFVNTVRTFDGGTHIEGLEIAVTRTLNKIARQRNKLEPDDEDLAGQYIGKGLTAIVSVMHPNPEWAGPTRTRLANAEARWIVGSIVSEVLTEYLVSRPNAEIRRREEILIPDRSRANDLHPS